MTGKFKRWFLHKLGGIPAEDAYITEHTINVCHVPIIKLYSEFIIDPYLKTCDNYEEYVYEELAIQLGKQMLKTNLIHFNHYNQEYDSNKNQQLISASIGIVDKSYFDKQY